MKPVAVDEMFPEGSGPYVDLDEVIFLTFYCTCICGETETP